MNSLSGWVLRSLDVVVMVTFMAAVVVVAVVMTEVARKFTTFTDGMSNDRCDGSSNKNECNGKFDLNHF